MKNESKIFDRRLKLPRSIFSDSISSDMGFVIYANPMAGIEGQDSLTPEDVANLIGGGVLDYDRGALYKD